MMWRKFGYPKRKVDIKEGNFLVEYIILFVVVLIAVIIMSKAY